MMKKFYVGVKGLVRSDKGFLIIKHARGYWDLPGGRLDDDEDLEDGLIRELSEELPNCKLKTIGNQIGAHRVHKDIDDDISLVLIYFVVDVEVPEAIELSHEHTECLWVNKESDFPEPMDQSMRKVLLSQLKK